MKKAERIIRIMEILEQLYPNPPIPLKHKDAYTLLVSILLSAQCTDERVNKVTPALFNLADTPKKMAELEVEQVYKIIRPCGLAPAKSKNIVELSRLLVERHQSVVPCSFEELESLPGVGHKTASVVMAQAFNVPAVPVDTHIHRLMQRWKLSSGISVTQTERDFKKCFPEDRWNKLHLQMIFFGREFCPARISSPERCCSVCLFTSKGACVKNKNSKVKK